MAGKRNTTINRDKANVSSPNLEQNPMGLTCVPTKKKRRNHSFLRVIFRLIVVALLITGGVYIWKNWDTFSPDNAIFWINNKLAGKQSGDGFPVELTGSSVISISKAKEGLAMLSDNSLVLLNSGGGELMRRQHGFSNPILKSSGKWMLLADKGGKRVKIETRASTAVEMSTENNIVSADMGSNGNFALATNSSKGYTSEVVVYDRNKEEIYRWYDTEMIIMDVSLSKDGKSMAVVGVMAENGAFKSVLKIFEFNKKQAAAEYSSKDLMLFAVKYYPGGTVAAVGDHELWVFNKKGSIQQKHSYKDQQLSGFAFGDSAVSVVLRDFGGTENGTLMTVNPSGDKAYDLQYAGTFRDISSYNSGVLLLTSDKLYYIDSGGLKYSSEVTRDGRMVSALDKKVVVLGLTSLYETNLPTKLA